MCNRAWRLCARLVVGLGLLLLLGTLTSRAAEEPDSIGEYELKAAVLTRLPSFVTWPTNVAARPADPIVIGILGKDPFGPHLQNLSQKQPAGGRRFVVRACATPAEARQCHLLFISNSERSQLTGVLAELRDAGVLTVSDVDRFAEAGGMVRLVAAKRRVGLQINLAVLRQAGLRADPQLLQLAKVVETASVRK